VRHSFNGLGIPQEFVLTDSICSEQPDELFMTRQKPNGLWLTCVRKDSQLFSQNSNNTWNDLPGGNKERSESFINMCTRTRMVS